MCGQARVVLQEQPLRILLMLLEARGEIVTREDIKKRLWPNDTVVEFDHSVHTAISKLRKALAIRLTFPLTSRPWPVGATGSWCWWSRAEIPPASPLLVIPVRTESRVLRRLPMLRLR